MDVLHFCARLVAQRVSFFVDMEEAYYHIVVIVAPTAA